ncbi:hypothetical protein FNV43_RR23963 [Rhamnella rubrinervis]|uniref:Uncharacterized protein n=1 Tax=Rhamnella rubrinervis TaxID=2594499 RepID=A0A8K0DLY0_9ROSA|nr:hypothetical protein FNV43_RR23963 [Rhamnella rubrinervis]
MVGLDHLKNASSEIGEHVDRQRPDNVPPSSSRSSRSNQQTLHVPPSANSSSGTSIIEEAFKSFIIKGCMGLRMTNHMAINTLRKYGNIHPHQAEAPWNDLENRNPDFFKVYNEETKTIAQEFNLLLDLQNCLLTEHLKNPQPSIPFPPAEHRNLLGMHMDSGNEMERNENVATYSEHLHLPSGISGAERIEESSKVTVTLLSDEGLDPASRSQLDRMEQSLNLSLKGEPKSNEVNLKRSKSLPILRSETTASLYDH